MANTNFNSAILDQQELTLLTSPINTQQTIKLSVYTYKVHINHDNYHINFTNTIEELILLLSASPRLSVLVLPDNITTHPLLNKLTTLLKMRQDIPIFWLGKMPSMDFELDFFIHCQNSEQLHDQLLKWFQRIEYWFKRWLMNYHVTLISNNEDNKVSTALTATGLSQLQIFNGTKIENNIINDQLLIIDLTTTNILFIGILKHLALNNRFPTLILFGDLSANQCRAARQLAVNFGFTILATLNSTPNQQQWEQMLLLLCGDVYVKHWINETPDVMRASGIYNLEDQQLQSYFCSQEMKREQIVALPNKESVRRVISALVLDKWFPEGVSQKSASALADYLNCQASQIDLYIDSPETIPSTSPIFAVLVMARLQHFKIYWYIKNETQFSVDVLKNYPISDLIFSESISHKLLTTPGEELLSFIEQAKQQEIRLGATLQQNKATSTAMSLYGIEFVLNKQLPIE
ncbi:hypothetical protein [Psychromonas sp. MME2]|uniref:hypothetical protein n=1 Tax=unclassified Psychromonas TaxID=2614957 RepID=UPI00339CEB7B